MIAAEIPNAYHPEAWRELYVTLGGAVAALTGLLFVATSLHVERIAKTPHWARRAFANTFSLIGVMIEALLVLIPQPANWLGTELIVLNLFLLVVLMLPLIRSWLRTVAGMPPLRLFAGTMSWLVGAAGGAGLIFHAGGGMYLVTASIFALIWVCVWNAWSLLIANYEG
jgi:modulator of FtsH protease